MSSSFPKNSNTPSDAINTILSYWVSVNSILIYNYILFMVGDWPLQMLPLNLQSCDSLPGLERYPFLTIPAKVLSPIQTRPYRLKSFLSFFGSFQPHQPNTVYDQSTGVLLSITGFLCFFPLLPCCLPRYSNKVYSAKSSTL